MGASFIEIFRAWGKRSLVLNFSVITLTFSNACFAIDSYRYLHVTIDTPWWIFLFLLPAVLSPFILMAILYWRFAGKKRKTERHDEG